MTKRAQSLLAILYACLSVVLAVASTSAHAAIPNYTGANGTSMGLNCTGAGTAVQCPAVMNAVEKQYVVGFTHCNSFGGPAPTHCLGSTAWTQYGPVMASNTPDSLVLAAYNDLLYYQNSIGIANSTQWVVSFGDCAWFDAPTNNIYKCNVKAQAVQSDGATPPNYTLTGTPYTSGNITVNAWASQPALCAGYLGDGGCPTSLADLSSPLGGSSGMCLADNAIEKSIQEPTVGMPINLQLGTQVESKLDLAWPIPFARTYSSGRTLGYTMGTWRHSHDSQLVTTVSGGGAFVAALDFVLEDESRIAFARANTTVAFAPTFAVLKGYSVSMIGPNYQLTFPTGSRRMYSPSGLMLSKTDRSGFGYSYSYDGTNRLSSITDSYGRILNLTYSPSANVISQISTTNGSTTDTVDYVYSSGYLASATFNSTEATTYGYNAAGQLSSITDPLAKTYAQFAYDATSGKAIQSKLMVSGSSSEQTDVSYGTGSATVTENGAASVFTIARDSANVRTRVSSATLGGSASNYSVSYSATGKASGLTTGTHTKSYVIDATTLLPSTATREDGKVATLTWDIPNRLLTNISESSPQGTRVTHMTYDALGNMLTQSVTSGASSVRSRSWTYTTFGRPLTATAVDGSVTTYEYWPDNDSAIERRGELKSITNALSQKISMTTYDLRGNPTTIVDPNLISTTLSYNSRNQILTQARSGVSVANTYDVANQLKTATYSNGYVLTLGYDDAHRLISASDSNGDSVGYVYDAYGNRSQTNLSRSSSLVLAVNQSFTALKQPKSTWAATLGEAVTTTYDSNGLPTGGNDGLARSVTKGFNAMGELTSTSDPGISTTLGRDLDGNLTSVAGGGVTNTIYTWNDFHEMLTMSGPDSGSQSMTHNATTRVDTRTDNAGVVHTVTSDALGRPASISHALGGSTLSESFGYDAGANGVGHLTSETDSASSKTWTWNAFGLPASKSQIVSGVTLGLAYGYDASGQLTSITYPSGMVVSYAYYGGRVSSVSVNGVALITNIGYRPMSNEAVSWMWATGGTYLKSFDANGKISGVSDTGFLGQATAFDGALRLSTLTDTGFSLSTTYSAADQLSGITLGAQTQTFGFNSNLNRTSKKYFSGQTDTITVPSSGNLPSTVVNTPPTVSKTYAFDSRKNTTDNGRGTFIYDLRGNLSQATVGGTVSTYAYDAFNHRVKKSVGATSTLFLYDEGGNLTGEYAASGAAQSEHIYLGAIPIGVASGGALYSVHTDYLGTPRVVSYGSTIVWKWDSTDPFGVNTPSVSTLTYNKRFPGQYFDAETGLHDNRFRVYDPQMGRYMQPDPLGLAAGKNPFNYTNQNPLNGQDPDGLDCTSANGKTRCAFPGGGPNFEVDTPANFKDYKNSDIYYHSYEVKTSIGCANENDVQAMLIQRPAPGTPSPATIKGTANNAQTLLIDNLVVSYATKDLITGEQLVVNITNGSSNLKNGFVARSVSNGVIHTYGEGNSPYQSTLLIPFVSSYLFFYPIPAIILAGQKMTNEFVWQRDAKSVLKACGCDK